MLGFAYAEIAGEPYWDETACWEFTAADVDLLDDATAELERLARCWGSRCRWRWQSPARRTWPI